MKKILFVLLLTICCQYSWASEIREYTLNKMEVMDDAGKVEVAPLLTLEKEPMTMKLTIAGLGTNRITAQCPIWSLAINPQIYLMDKPTYETGIDETHWYYIRHDQGVTVIELKKDNVKVHNLGMVPYTYVGVRNKYVEVIK